MNIAVYVSTHGYGHFVRAGAVCLRLAERIDARFLVCAAAPRVLWPPALALRTEWREFAADAGVVQSGDLAVDLQATRARVDRFVRGFADQVEREAAWLRNRAVGFVIGDVPPLAFAAAYRAGLKSAAVANFSWDWIYREMGMEAAADQAADAYARAGTLFALAPDTPMPAFGRRIDAGLLGRKAATDRHLVREALRVKPHHRLVLLSLRAEGRNAAVRLPAPMLDVFYVMPGDAGSRDDLVSFPVGRAYEDVVAAADVVVTKPGYGIVGDTAANGTPMLWAARQGFPEDDALQVWIQANLLSRRVGAEELARGAWREALEDLLDKARRDPLPVPAAARVAEEITRLIAD